MLPILILFAFLGGAESQHDAARAAMDRWERAVFVRFVEVEKPVVVICFDHNLCPCEYSFGQAVAHAQPYTWGALVHINPETDWSRLSLEEVMTHELGHVIQYDHWRHSDDRKSCLYWMWVPGCQITYKDQMDVCKTWGCKPRPLLVINQEQL